jgi:hypothetical protein
LKKYLLSPVRSGNSGGYSDITFINKDNTEELNFISVKYFKKEKPADKYDIPKLAALLKKHTKEDRKINLYIFVKNKKDVIEKFKKQHKGSDILIDYINPKGSYENIYDINDLEEYYIKLKHLLEQYNYFTTDTINLFQSKYLKVVKSIFEPRFHQKLFITKINKLIENKETNILVGAIPRSGKSYIMAGTILEHIKNNPDKKLKFLMMTPAPNETFGEYKSIFNTYIEFEELNIDVMIYDDKYKKKDISEKNHTIIIISKQRLGWKSNKLEQSRTDDDNNKDEEEEEE